MQDRTDTLDQVTDAWNRMIAAEGHVLDRDQVKAMLHAVVRIAPPLSRRKFWDDARREQLIRWKHAGLKSKEISAKFGVTVSSIDNTYSTLKRDVHWAWLFAELQGDAQQPSESVAEVPAGPEPEPAPEAEPTADGPDDLPASAADHTGVDHEDIQDEPEPAELGFVSWTPARVLELFTLKTSGLTFRQIGERFGCSEGAVGAQYRKIKREDPSRFAQLTRQAEESLKPDHDQVAAAIAAGKVTRCPPAYVAPVNGAERTPEPVPVYGAGESNDWRAQRDLARDRGRKKANRK